MPWMDCGAARARWVCRERNQRVSGGRIPRLPAAGGFLYFGRTPRPAAFAPKRWDLDPMGADSMQDMVSADRAQRPLFFGVDVGGTNIKFGLVDDQGQTVARRSIRTEQERGP